MKQGHIDFMLKIHYIMGENKFQDTFVIYDPKF